MLRLLVYFLTFFFLATGCERNESSIEKSEPYFSYSLYNEGGNRISQINGEVKNIKSENSYALWGNNLSATEVKSLDNNRESTSKIIFHTENEHSDGVDHITFVFRLSGKEVLTPGKYSHPEYDLANWLTSVEEFWKMRQEHREGVQVQDGTFRLPIHADSIHEESTLTSVIYLESGFNGNNNPYLYSALQGNLTIHEVDETKIKGDFSISLAGVPWDIFERDEFNEDFDFREHQAVGSFIAEKGDYTSLKQINADLSPLQGLRHLNLN